MSAPSRFRGMAHGSRTHTAVRLGGTAGLVALVYAVPYLVEPFRLISITSACVYAIVIVGLNLLSGYGGQVSLGHAAFFGLGAYTTGVMTVRYQVAPLVSFVVGVALCFVLGSIVSFPALRLRGVYLALVTLAVGLIFPSLVTRLDALTGGSAGLFGIEYSPPRTGYFSGLNGPIYWHYWLAVAALALVCLVVSGIVHSRFGRGLIALRDNESAAIVMGVNRALTRTLVFGASAAIAGLGGGLYAVVSGILTPASFSLLLTLYFLAGMVMGGPGTFWGPILGGFIVFFVPVWAADLSGTDSGASLSGVVLGVLLIAITFGFRGGVAGLLGTAWRRLVVEVPSQAERSTPSESTHRTTGPPGARQKDVDSRAVGSGDYAALTATTCLPVAAREDSPPRS
jgi:branched-chain amino acid transport system permease protein